MEQRDGWRRGGTSLPPSALDLLDKSCFASIWATVDLLERRRQCVCTPTVAIFVKSKPLVLPIPPQPLNLRHLCRAQGQGVSSVGHFDLTCSWKNRKSSCWRFSTWPSHWLIAGFSAQDAASFVCVKTAVCTLYLGAFGELYLTSFVSASQSLPRPSPHGSPGPHGLDSVAGAGGGVTALEQPLLAHHGTAVGRPG